MSVRLNPRVVSLLLVGSVLLGIAGGGCVTPTGPDQNQPIGTERGSDKARVYLLRGLLDIFSLGLNDLAQKMRDEGVYAEAISGPLWPSLLDSVTDLYTEPVGVGPLVLMGHSYGADDAIRMSHVLNDRGITVDLLLLLDATDPGGVPDNVDRCLHLYVPSALGDLIPDLFAGNPVEAEPDNQHTVIVNRPLTVEEFGERVSDVNHFTGDTSELAHDIFIAEVLALIGQPMSANPVRAITEGEELATAASAESP